MCFIIILIYISARAETILKSIFNDGNIVRKNVLYDLSKFFNSNASIILSSIMLQIIDYFINFL